jgi:hypothetical protein
MMFLFWCYSQQQYALHFLVLHDLRFLALLVSHLVALQDSVCLCQPSVMVELTVRISQMSLIVVSSVSILLFYTWVFYIAVPVVDVFWNHVSFIYIHLTVLICSFVVSLFTVVCCSKFHDCVLSLILCFTAITVILARTYILHSLRFSLFLNSQVHFCCSYVHSQQSHWLLSSWHNHFLHCALILQHNVEM